MQTSFDILPSQKSSEDVGCSNIKIVWLIQEQNFITVELKGAGSKSSGKYQVYASYALEARLILRIAYLFPTKSLIKTGCLISMLVNIPTLKN